MRATDDPGGHRAAKAAHERAAETHDRAAELHEESARLHEEHAAEMRESELAEGERIRGHKHRRSAEDEELPPQ